MTIKYIDIYRFSLPMEPFAIATGVMDYAQNILIFIHTNQGLTGIGECSAFPVITRETQDTCFDLAKDFAKIWKGKDASQIDGRMEELDNFISNNHTIKSAFDMALYDLAAKAVQQPLYQYLGGTYFEPESDLTIGINTVSKMAETAYDFVTNRKVKIIKVKLGKKVEEDILRIKAIREAVGSPITLRIDANQGWNYEDAVTALTAMKPFNIQLCEQPLPKKMDERMPSLRHISPIPIMADESVFSPEDALQVIHNASFDFINIKLCKAGGIRKALEIHHICKENNIINMLGGMLESRVGLSAKVHLALACPNIKYYDLDTCLLGHKTDPVINGVQFDGMKLKIPDLPGIGADVDTGYLKKCERLTI